MRENALNLCRIRSFEFLQNNKSVFQTDFTLNNFARDDYTLLGGSVACKNFTRFKIEAFAGYALLHIDNVKICAINL